MKQTVLIADGDAELGNLHLRFLREGGYQVEAAFDGLECLRKLRRNTPAALVLDLDLRWGGGDGVLDWIREETSMHGVPVILTSKAGYPQGLAEFNDALVVRFLPKPFTRTALLESVHSAIAFKPAIELSNGSEFFRE